MADIKSNQVKTNSPAIVQPTGSVTLEFSFSNATEDYVSASDRLLALKLPAGALITGCFAASSSATANAKFSVGTAYTKANNTDGSSTTSVYLLEAAAADTARVLTLDARKALTVASIPGDAKDDTIYLTISANANQANAKFKDISGFVTYTLQKSERFVPSADQ